jgi:nicotinate-nucleotide--dimethylbenzimidazole phosphoribosyltransferase
MSEDGAGLGRSKSAAAKSPAEQPDLATIAADVPWPDHEAEQAARAQHHRLGELDALAEWLAGVQGRYPPTDPGRVRALVFAGDHGIAAAGVSAYPADATARWVADIEQGGGLVNVLAALAQASVRLVDVGVGKGGGRIDREDALSSDEAKQAAEVGIAVADEEIESGADLLVVGDLGVGATTIAATLISVITNTEPIKVTGRGGAGIDDLTWMRKASAIRDARLRAWEHRAAPLELLATAGGADIAALAGTMVRAAARRTPVLIDGVVAAAAALVAQELQPRCVRWWRAGQRTAEPAQAVALRRLGLDSILDLGVQAGDGSGALLAVPALRAAARTTTTR